jgi:uncharacterized RDD family membrane protein YckC
MAFCTSCGSQVDQDTRFCHKCGQPVGAAAPVASPAPLASTPPATPVQYAAPAATYAAQPANAPPVYAAPPAYAVPPAYAQAPTSQYGGFWIRFVAYIVDGLIIGIPMTAIIVTTVLVFGAGSIATLKALPSNPDPDQIQNQLMPMIAALIGAYALFILGAIVISWLYFALMESSERQGTFGKAMLNLRVSDANGNRLSFGHASGRYFSKVITGLVPFGIGYIMAGFTQKKQALHDFIAGTVVIRTL